MIKYTQNDDGTIYVETYPVGPSVYLDIWMWRRLAEDDCLREEFVSVDKDSQCCLMYSFISFIELARLDDSYQIKIISEVMDILDFGFIEVNPSKVIRFEDQHESSEPGVFKRRHPAADTDFLDYLARNATSDNKLKISTIYDDLKKESVSRYSAMVTDLGSLTRSIEDARNDINNFSGYRKEHKNKNVSRTAPPYTRDIFNILQYYLIVNKNMKLDPKEWMDIFNTIVPVAYMKYVLLDKRWTHFVRAELPIKPPDLATVYNQNEMTQFLESLKREQIPPQP